MSFKHIWARKGFKQFLVRSVIFFIIFILNQILVIPILEITRLKNFPPFRILDLGVAFLFSLVLLFVMIKDRIKQVPIFKRSFKETFLFAVLYIIFLSLYLYNRYFVSNNFNYILNNFYWFWVFLMCLLIVLMFLSLILAIYNLNFTRYFLKNFRRNLIISLSLVVLVALFIFYLRKIWTIFALAIGNSVYFLLRLFFKDVNINIQDIESIKLSIGNFRVSLGEECSGIESMALFTVLYILIFVLDRHKLNKKKMLCILILGVLGSFLVNLLRVFTILVIGVYTSPKFAVGLFHSNAGWLLFIAYFVGFWWVAYPWVKLKKALVKK